MTLLLLSCLRGYVYERLEPREQPVETPVPTGLTSISAQTCETCHAEIAAEWKTSRMGQAYDNALFQADFVAQGEPYICLRCHSPLLEQQPLIVTGIESFKPLTAKGTENPLYDPELQHEGVTCVACHLQDGAMVAGHEDVNAPHPTAVGTIDCGRCHQLASPPLWSLERDIADTVGEHSRWSGTKSCVDCHMPTVERPLVEGYPVRSGHRHTFPGAWSDDMVRSAVTMEVVRSEGATKVLLTNTAGHNVPTTEPAHVLRLTVGEQTVDFSRVIDGRKELSDTTLLPDETRTLDFEGTGAVKLEFMRFGLHPALLDEAGVENHTVLIASVDAL